MRAGSATGSGTKSDIQISGDTVIKTFKNMTQKQKTKVSETLQDIAPILQQLNRNYYKGQEIFMIPKNITPSGYETSFFSGTPAFYLLNKDKYTKEDYDYFDSLMERSRELFQILDSLEKSRIHHPDIETNILFDPKKGFRVIDFDQVQLHRDPKKKSATSSICVLMKSIISKLNFDSDYADKTHLDTLRDLFTQLERKKNCRLRHASQLLGYITDYYQKPKFVSDTQNRRSRSVKDEQAEEKKGSNQTSTLIFSIVLPLSVIAGIVVPLFLTGKK